MSAHILGPEHLLAAKRRQAVRDRAAAQAREDAARYANRRPTLDEIMGRGSWWPPRGGDAA
jgi:hypothetical protein